MVLTLANSLGSAQRTFRVISVTDAPAGIAGTSSDEVTAYTVDGGIIVDVAEVGNYGICVYNAAGQQVATMNQQLSANQKVKVALGQPGVYVVTIAKDDKQLRTVKLIRK